ncbi:hypothetical protein OIU76_015816 [Salix suchowensis]|uniref:Uncharacterized protein n=1 Tax=Salix suchowensis TaxID=1278906 RepID=A0ABQ9BPJ7_9ROSI|nr:hypothetical protein OIU76_015816 [Salix suchowensis]KAJ6346522.1 hypothetical protein OIU78_009034 [Salix suchowensis]KAJ6386397.1 hypothetical protein OIU77_029375 [Salix suchowensis]
MSLSINQGTPGKVHLTCSALFQATRVVFLFVESIAVEYQVKSIINVASVAAMIEIYVAAISCCSDNEVQLPVTIWFVTLTAKNGQQLPHEPRFLTGVTAPAHRFSRHG